MRNADRTGTKLNTGRPADIVARSDMGLISALAIYFIIWWLVLFLVLPLGVRTQAEAGKIVAGSVPSAPVHPHLLKKTMATTVLAGIVFAGVYLIYTYKLITLDVIPLGL